MLIGQFKEYKGYIGSIEYDTEDELLYGKLLHIKDLVNYHASNVIELEKYYHEAVDDYIEFKEEIEKEKIVATKLTEEQFYKKHCQMCGSQRCEGIGTDWFEGCTYKEELIR